MGEGSTGGGWQIGEMDALDDKLKADACSVARSELLNVEAGTFVI